MFTSVEDARRHEADACAMLRICHDHIAGEDFATNAFCEGLAGGLACYIAPDSPANKVAGLGFEGLPTDEQFDAIEARFKAQNCPVTVEFASLADASVAAALCDRGYRCVGFENVLGRALKSIEESYVLPDGARITPSPDDELARWLDVTVAGFLSPDTEGVTPHEEFEHGPLRRDMGAFASMPGMSRLIVTRHNEDAAGASLWIHNATAVFCGASVLPAHRRHGIQTALIAQRLRFAKASGCTQAVVTTSPGSKSQQNMQRHGFAMLYTRAIFTK